MIFIASFRLFLLVTKVKSKASNKYHENIDVRSYHCCVFQAAFSLSVFSYERFPLIYNPVNFILLLNTTTNKRSVIQKAKFCDDILLVFS